MNSDMLQHFMKSSSSAVFNSRQKQVKNAM